jgi:hypothetical protein
VPGFFGHSKRHRLWLVDFINIFILSFKHLRKSTGFDRPPNGHFRRPTKARETKSTPKGCDEMPALYQKCCTLKTSVGQKLANLFPQ